MAQKIEIVRGTTNTFNITVTDADGVLYTTTAGEKIIFGIKKKPEVEETPIFSKVASYNTAGNYLATIDPDDTEELKPGQYFYDVGLQSGENYYSVIKPSPFVILANVTEWGCAD